MKFYGKAEESATIILEAFRNPNRLPKPLAQVFIHRKDNVPCRSWSWRNQLLVALRGFKDARGFRQWQEVGRSVKKGERAFYILSPLSKKVQDDKTGEEKTIIYGFKGTPVFGYEQTDGKPLPPADPEAARWVETLPLIEVARAWGLSVELFNGKAASYLGAYRHHAGIALGVKNLSTWAHELVHAADHRNGKLNGLGQHWRNETVAELGGAVLLQILGYPHDADLGGCWEYIQRYAEKAGLEVIDACGKVLQRTCEAVALILDTADALREKEEAVA
jgi:antirestriction protein ArdC